MTSTNSLHDIRLVPPPVATASRLSGFIEVLLQSATNLCPRPVQQHPLIRLGDPQAVTHFPRCPRLDVAQDDHLALAGRQSVDRLADDGERLASKQPLLGDIPRPRR